MLNLESISVSYGKHAVLSGLDLTIKEGVVAGLLGPNGCGKSTLVRSIAGAQHCHGSVSYGKRSGRALQDVTQYGYGLSPSLRRRRAPLGKHGRTGQNRSARPYESAFHVPTQRG